MTDKPTYELIPPRGWTQPADPRRPPDVDPESPWGEMILSADGRNHYDVDNDD